MCLENTVSRKGQLRDDVIEQSAKWAEENLGLPAKNWHKNTRVYKQLSSAITRGLRRGKLKASKDKIRKK